MNHETQVELLDELLGLRQAQSAYLDEKVTHSSAERYLDEAGFQRERSSVFRGSPIFLAHASELPEEGSFLLRDCLGVPVLLTRDRNGDINAFYNVCRHRGARLVEKESGCRHRFTCPYHAWTWDNTGRLIAIPHREQGFPDLDMTAYGLKRISCKEAFGGIWCLLDGHADDDWLDSFLKLIAGDLEWLDIGNHEVHASETRVWDCNWKIIVEGGLEAYHFRVAHAKTIGSLFHDNLSTYRLFGPHIRSILARASVDDLVEVSRNDWRIRQHANVLYNLFPNTALLVQGDHIVWLSFMPLSVSQTQITVTTLRPKQADPLTDKQTAYWDKNHALTVTTLNEDFEIGEKIQAGLAHGVNTSLTFGRFEGALDAFNQTVDHALQEL